MEVRPVKNRSPDPASNPTTGHPTRPTDVPHDVTLTDLATAYGVHSGRLVDAQHGIGEALPGDQLAAHAVAALATSHALADRALWSRWCNVADALRHGATIEAVAEACGRPTPGAAAVR